MGFEAIGGVSAGTRNGAPPNKIGTAGQSDFEKILEAFQKAASETPAERARDSVLKKHGLTEDSYKALRGPAREAIDKEIEQAVRLALKAQANGQQRPATLDI